MTLAEKRAALSAHLTKIGTQSAAHEAAFAPVIEINERLEPALAELVSAEKAHSAALRAEADCIVACGDISAATDAVNRTAADLDQKRRVVSALQSEKTAREAAAADTALSLNISSSATEGLVAAVVDAVTDDIVADLVAAGEKFTRSQAAAKTLAAHITGKGWFAIAERLNERLNGLKITAWQSQQHPAWAKFTTELASNADAVPGVAQ
jgi:hypothetical protein